MSKILIGLAAIIVLLSVIVIINTLSLTTKQIDVPSVEPRHVDSNSLAVRLAEAVRFRTVSHQNPADNDVDGLLAFHRWLQQSYPAAHQVLKRETVNEHSLLYTWEGEDPSLEPVMLLAHMDAVPAETADPWTNPPFGGVISDGFVWGRGTLDMKGILVAIMEAVEHKVAEGHKPQRTIMFAFGHDEEVSGLNGAAKIAELLKSRGIRLKWVLDEGSVITQGVIPLMDAPVALIGTAEKGYLTIKLVARGEGGTTAMPPYDTSVSRLAQAITRLQHNQLAGGIDGLTKDMLDTLGPEFPLTIRVVIANQWLFGPLIERVLSTKRTTNALLRTTIAPTMLEASPKENVLSEKAIATINLRIHPRDSIESVLKHVGDLFDKDPWVGVEIASMGRSRNPSPVSSTTTEGYKAIERTIREVFPDTIVAPSLVVVGTDSRHFSEVADAVYRFGPFSLNREDLKRIHGGDERVRIEDLANAVSFYMQLMDNL